jgi:hypothetical protein
MGQRQEGRIVSRKRPVMAVARAVGAATQGNAMSRSDAAGARLPGSASAGIRDELRRNCSSSAQQAQRRTAPAGAHAPRQLEVLGAAAAGNAGHDRDVFAGTLNADADRAAGRRPDAALPTAPAAAAASDKTRRPALFAERDRQRRPARAATATT